MTDKINLKNIRPRKNAPGAGRPSTVEAGKGHRVFVSDSEWQYLQETGNGNASLGTRILIERDQLNQTEK